MRIAYLSPLPPSRTGIAHYSAIVLPALQEQFDVKPFGSIEGYERDAFDVAIYQLGNNPHHEWIYSEALRKPGVAVLHDVVLHHLIVEMTLARDDGDAYVAALRENHGPAGAAWARGRAAGLHSEMGNFLFPASIHVANRSRSVIVHNRWAADLLRSFDVVSPIEVVPHPFVQANVAADRTATRTRLGLAPGDRVIGFFGFLTSAKRAEVVLQAFEEARKKNRSLKLLIAGEPAPNIDPATLSGEGITLTGYVPDEEFDAYYAAADLLVNLRYPSAGETSGTLIRAFDAGKPVAVSDYAQFAELDDSIVTKIAFGTNEVHRLTEFFLGAHDVAAIANAQRQWLTENAVIGKTVDGYKRAIEAAAAAATAKSRRVPDRALSSTPLTLFPDLELVRVESRADIVELTVENRGDAAIRTRSYGTPAYRLLAKIFDGDVEVESHWLDLPGDLPPGGRDTVAFRSITSPPHGTLRLYDALQSVALVEPEAWASHELSR